jgi:hypothetical protein
MRQRHSLIPRTVVLVGCVSKKQNVRATAKDLYSSALWRKRRAYAEKSGQPWLILSAFHGVVDPDSKLDPYDLALADLPIRERRAWGVSVVQSLEAVLGSVDDVTFEIHAGTPYRASIEPLLTSHGATVVCPVAGLSIGQQLAWYGRQAAQPEATTSRRRHASEREVNAALAALDHDPNRIAASAWPGTLKDLDSPGLYSWWVDQGGARDLSLGLGEKVEPGRIYAGQTGATKWPSGVTGKATLRSRIGSQHIRGRIGGSTFRLTLAAALVQGLNLDRASAGRLDPGSEKKVSAWIGAHLELATHAFTERDPLKNLEDRVLVDLDPPLNIEGMRATSIRTKLVVLRRGLNA